ncbi:MAG: branched chain amino acid aminotransferase, partial [Clostridia bacterium]|nr:branched chain amino acid aminotransferase [Clostridia bacterium]
GYKVSERLLSIDELAEALEKGTLEEAWGCGTAAVVSPIGELSYKDKKFTINGGKIGEVTQKLYDTLTGIQWGKIEDKFGWTMKI